MIPIRLQQETATKKISISNIILLLSVLTIPVLIFTVHFLSVLFSLCINYEYYEVGTTYLFHINIYDNYTVIMGFVHILLFVNFISVILIIGLKMTKKTFFTPRKLKIDGLKLVIVFLLMVLALNFLLYHNVAQLNRLRKAIQIFERSDNVANIMCLGFQFSTEIALIDFFLIPEIIIIIIIVTLVFIRR